MGFNIHKSKLETVAAIIFSVFWVANPVICYFFFLYILTTRIWWFSLLYLIWMYIDKDSPRMGGGSMDIILKSNFFKYLSDYFSTRLKCDNDFELSPNRNYLFCCFPHGILPAGPFLALTSKTSKFHQMFPNFTVKMAAIDLLFKIPFSRELIKGMGLMSCSAEALSYVLSRPEGGYIINLMVGGVAESYNTAKERYVFLIKKRKGFIRIALKNGTSLVPVVTFGENNLFHHVQNTKFRSVQKYIQSIVGFAPLIFYGRGFTCVPYRTSITTVVGKPIEVTKTENPTDKDVENLHEKFVQELVKLFNKYKIDYVDDPDNTPLELE